MKLLRRLTAGCAALIAASAIAYSAGYFPGFPVVGGPAYCTSFLMNPITGAATTTCNGPQTPAGPLALTGNELIPADTALTQGQNPATVLIQSGFLAAIGQGSERNALRGGDFGTNLWQRGTSFATITPTVATMTADGWFAYSSGNTVTVNKQTGASDINTAPLSLGSMRVVRPSGTDVTAICVGQFLPQKASARLVSQNNVFSAYIQSGAGFSAAGGNITMTIAYVTATDSATAGTNTATFALSTTTGYTAAVASTQAITSTFARYYTNATIPSTATSVGVKICYTPVGTGGATDWFEFSLAQLEPMPTGITSPGSFARRSTADESLVQQSYSYVITEPAASVSVAPSGQGASTTTCVLTIPPPTTMRIVPVVAFAGTALSTSTWTVTHVVTNTALGTPFLAATTGGHTVNAINLTATVASGLTAGQTCTLTGAAGGSLIVASSEP